MKKKQALETTANAVFITCILQALSSLAAWKGPRSLAESMNTVVLEDRPFYLHVVKFERIMLFNLLW